MTNNTTNLYKNFSEARLSISNLAVEIYPLTRQFIDTVEPELNLALEKMSANKQDPLLADTYFDVAQYMNTFDDFIVSANRLFTDMKQTIDISASVAVKIPDALTTDAVASTSDIAPELRRLTKDMTVLLERSGELKRTISRLKSNWAKTRQKLTP
jgi:hypothetical protein